MQNKITQESETNSRRAFFTRGAVVAASTLLATRLVPQASAQTAGAPTEVEVLNFALSLEHLEAAFYVQGLMRFTATDIGRLNIFPLLGTRITDRIYANLQAVRDHEVAHVKALQDAITGLRGTPVAACTYNFGFSNVEDFLLTAAVLENTGVMAYVGAVRFLNTPALLTAGGSIATVEARHAALLNMLTEAIPFPAAFDMPRTIAQITAAVAPYIASCPPPGTTPPSTMGTTAVANPKNATTAVQQMTLDGSMSRAEDGGALTYRWRVVQGVASLNRGDTAMPIVQFSGGFGTYIFELRVTDSKGTEATDTSTILYVGR